MTLNSLSFAGFFLPVALIHRLLPARFRNLFLLLVSWIFYAICAPQFLPLLLCTILLSYGLALAMDCRPQHRKRYLLIGLIMALGILFLFKYLVFFANLLSVLLHPIRRTIPAIPALLLPVGISFYTFTICGYLMDVYRQKRPAEKNFVDMALFSSFFPAILSGPIARSTALLPQLKQHRLPDSTPSSYDAKLGITRFLWGLFLKMVLADRLAVLVNTAYGAPEQFSGMQLLAAVLAYSLQIYCDFCGYSHMAIGTARILGIQLPENFSAPYLARSVKEFWRRWHISLSTWFRDYLYFPLGGSRRGRMRTWCNVLIVFTISGLWHGAAITFVVWGLLNGLYQVIGSILEPCRHRLRRALKLREDGLLLQFLQTGLCFLLLSVTWIFFRASNLGQAITVLTRIGTMAGASFPLHFTQLGLNQPQLIQLGIMVLILLVFDAADQRTDLLAHLCHTTWLRYVAWVVLILVIALFGAYGTGYNAQDFLYFQF